MIETRVSLAVFSFNTDDERLIVVTNILKPSRYPYSCHYCLEHSMSFDALYLSDTFFP